LGANKSPYFAFVDINSDVAFSTYVPTHYISKQFILFKPKVKQQELKKAEQTMQYSILRLQLRKRVTGFV